MRKVALAMLAVVALTTVASAQLNLFYDVRSNIAVIDAPAAPFIYSASLSPWWPDIGRNYPLYGTPLGGRGDGQNIYVSPFMPDTTDWTGTGAPDGVPESTSFIDPSYDHSVGAFYLYAAYAGPADPTKVVSSIGVVQSIPGAFASATNFYLASATTTLVNPTLWDGTAVTGSNASTSLKMVQVPVMAGPAFDPGVGIKPGQTWQIAKVDIVGASKTPGMGVGIYNVNLSENALLITNVISGGGGGALAYTFGYAAGVPDTGSAPDMVITVVRKGDFDFDGYAATGVDDFAYYPIGADPSLINPVEFWLGDFDGDGFTFTGVDDFQYLQESNVS